MVIIIGASSFIGVYTVEAFLNNGYEVLFQKRGVRSKVICNAEIPNITSSYAFSIKKHTMTSDMILSVQISGT
ncbi:hypothetical protein JT05_06760 [Desulfosporosinus sp. Tol-M]|nr:hypothetical protein JT05_06760 [Desulfosporosinus sp. Tol-M]